MHTLGPGGGVVFTKLKIYSFVARPPKSRNLKSKTQRECSFFGACVPGNPRKPLETPGNPHKNVPETPRKPLGAAWKICAPVPILVLDCASRRHLLQRKFCLLLVMPVGRAKAKGKAKAKAKVKARSQKAVRLLQRWAILRHLNELAAELELGVPAH